MQEDPRYSSGQPTSPSFRESSSSGGQGQGRGYARPQGGYTSGGRGASATEVPGGGGRRRVPWARRQRKRICAWCTDGTTTIDYKNVSKLRRFVNDRGKIMPRRQTGACARHQRAMARAIKRARVMALISFVSR